MASAATLPYTVASSSIAGQETGGGQSSDSGDEKKIGWALNIWAFLSIVASAVARYRLEDVLLELGLLNSQDLEEFKKKPDQDTQCSLFLNILHREDPEHFMAFIDAIKSFHPLLKILNFMRLKSNTWQARGELFDWKAEEFQDFERDSLPMDMGSGGQQPDSGFWTDYPQAEAAHHDWIIRAREDTIKSEFKVVQDLVAEQKQLRGMLDDRSNMVGIIDQDEDGHLSDDQILGEPEGAFCMPPENLCEDENAEGENAEESTKQKVKNQPIKAMFFSQAAEEERRERTGQESTLEAFNEELQMLLKAKNDDEKTVCRLDAEKRQAERDEALEVNSELDGGSPEVSGWVSAGVTTISAEDTSAHDQTHEKLLEQLAYSKHKEKELILEVDTQKGMLERWRNDFESTIETFRAYQQKLVEAFEELHRGKAHWSRDMASTFRMKEKLLLKKYEHQLGEEKRKITESVDKAAQDLETLRNRLREEEERTAGLSQAIEQIKEQKHKQAIASAKLVDRLEKEKQDMIDQVASLATEKEAALREGEEIKKEMERYTAEVAELEGEVKKLKERLARLQKAKEDVEKTRDFYFKGWQENLERNKTPATVQTEKAPVATMVSTVIDEEEKPRPQPMSLGHLPSSGSAGTSELAAGHARSNLMYSSFAAPSAPGPRVPTGGIAGMRGYSSSATGRSGMYFPPVTESLQRHVSPLRGAAGSATSGYVSDMESTDHSLPVQGYSAARASQRDLRGKSLPFAIDESATLPSQAQPRQSAAIESLSRQQQPGDLTASFLQGRYSGLQGRSPQCPFCTNRFPLEDYADHLRRCPRK